jgi:hypothetical protein
MCRLGSYPNESRHVRTFLVNFRVILFTTASLLAISAAPNTAKLPPDASAVIDRVKRAAEQHDWKALRNSMIKEFTWSFGGDRDADQAIQEWKNLPESIRELGRVLRAACRVDTTLYGDGSNASRIKCDGKGGAHFRAGFIGTSEGWKFEYFVAGD